MRTGRIVLGSRSPRRLDLLRQIWPAELIDVVPPSSTAEAHFENLHDWPSIERRLLEIAATKCEDVSAQVRKRFVDTAQLWDPNSKTPSPPTPFPQGERGEDLHMAPPSTNDVDPRTLSPLSPRGRGAGGEGAPGHCPTTAHGNSEPPIIVTADTIVVVERAGGLLHVLGQPPADDSWPETVRRWFREDYAGKTHLAATAVCVERLIAEGTALREERRARVVTSRVTFVADVDHWLDWYLATGEPRGKAGGYALQGAGSLFIEKVEGSLSNVVGLPLAELLDMLIRA